MDTKRQCMKFVEMRGRTPAICSRKVDKRMILLPPPGPRRRQPQPGKKGYVDGIGCGRRDRPP